jgi:hypothetical protein
MTSSLTKAEAKLNDIKLLEKSLDNWLTKVRAKRLEQTRICESLRAHYGLPLTIETETNNARQNLLDYNP